MEKARDMDNKLLFFSFVSCFGVSALLMCFAPLFPNFYNTTDTVKEIAMKLIMIAAAYMPVIALLHSAYYTLRSGGRTIITLLFDNGFAWCLEVPLAFILSYYTTWHVLVVYTMVMASKCVKTAVGVWLVKKGFWLQNIVASAE